MSDFPALGSAPRADSYGDTCGCFLNLEEGFADDWSPSGASLELGLPLLRRECVRLAADLTRRVFAVVVDEWSGEIRRCISRLGVIEVSGEIDRRVAGLIVVEESGEARG